MLSIGPLLTKVEAVIWAVPREGMTLWELADKMKELGNQVLEMDETNNRLKILHTVDQKEDT